MGYGRMRQFIFVAFALLASAGLALAGSPSNPDWVRNSQGSSITVVEVDCTATTTPLLSATQTADARALSFFNEGDGIMHLCPSATCTDATGVVLNDNQTTDGFVFQIRDSVADTVWSCLGVLGTDPVSVLIEK
jgi:hypothetical protein